MNITYRTAPPTIGEVVSVACAILIGLFILGASFAWATDSRPIEGSYACRVYQSAPLTEWKLERDGPMGCKPRLFWGSK